MPLREQCLWETLTPQRPQSPAFHGEISVDVCIIGAGITGLSAAIHLLEQGKTVCVLETACGQPPLPPGEGWGEGKTSPQSNVIPCANGSSSE